MEENAEKLTYSPDARLKHHNKLRIIKIGKVLAVGKEEEQQVEESGCPRSQVLLVPSHSPGVCPSQTRAPAAQGPRGWHTS